MILKNGAKSKKQFAVPTVTLSSRYKGGKRPETKSPLHTTPWWLCSLQSRNNQSFALFFPRQGLPSPTEVCFPQPSFIISNNYKTSSQIGFISLTTEVHSPTEFISLQRQNLPIKHSPSTELFSNRVNLQQNILKQKKEIPSESSPFIIPSKNEGFSFPKLSSSSPGFIFLDWETSQ